MTRYLIRLLNYLLLAGFLAAIWGGWYLSRQGFGQKWRKKLSEEFAERGIEMTARRLTLDPLRGLVARDVRVFSDGRQNQLIAKINELRLDIDYTRLLRNEPFLDALSLSEAEVKLDLDPRRKNSGELAFHHLEGRFYFAADHVEIRQFRGFGLGMWFSISGTLEHGATWQISTNPARLWKRFSSLPPLWLQRLAEVKFDQHPGRLDLTFHGNLAQAQWLDSAEMKISCPRVRWNGVELREIEGEGDFTDGTVSLRRLSLRDDRGPALLTGMWRSGSEGRLQIDSRLDGSSIFQQIDALAGLVVAGPMHLTADLSWTAAAAWKATGELNFSEILYRGVKWERLRAGFSLSPERSWVRDFELTQKTGAISGQMIKDGDRLRVEISSTAEPQSIWQTLAWEIPPILRDAEFPVSPVLRLTIDGPWADSQKWEINGDVILGRTHLRGVALTSGRASVNWIVPYFSFHEAQLTRPEGQFTGEIFWDACVGQLTFWNASSSIDLVAMSLWVDRSLADAAETMRPSRGILLAGSGQLQWAGEKLSKAELHLTGSAQGLLDSPIAAGWLKDFRSVQSAQTIAAEVFVGPGILQIDPLVVTGRDWHLAGKGAWILPRQLFSGVMRSRQTDETEAAETIWSASDAWNQVKWKREEPASALPSSSSGKLPPENRTSPVATP